MTRCRNDLKESSGAMKALDSVGSALYSLTEKESDSFNKVNRLLSISKSCFKLVWLGLHRMLQC